MSTGPTSPSPRLIPSVWKLLLLRIHIGWNSFKHARTSRKILTVVIGLAVAVFVGVIGFSSFLLLRLLRSPELAALLGDQVGAFLAAVPVLILAGLFGGILLTSFGVLLQALYLSGDLEFLLAAPVPIRAVFSAKLLQAVLPNLGLIALFGVPILFGLGTAEAYNPFYFPLVLVVMVALALAAAGMSALLVMLACRIFPPRRLAEVLAFITGTLVFTCSQSGNLFNAFGSDIAVSSQQWRGLLGMLLQANTPWLPISWAGLGLVAVGEGHWGPGLVLTGLTLALCALTFLACLATAERWYLRGLSRMKTVARARTRPPRPEARATGPREAGLRLPPLLPAAVMALVRKDFLVFRRDLRNLSQLLSPLIFGIMYTLMFFRMGSTPPAGMAAAPAEVQAAVRSLMNYGSIGLSLFVGWIVLSRLAGMGFSSEGRNFWIVKSAPLPARQLLAAKYLVAYLPALLLGLTFVLVISIVQKLTPADVLFSLYASAACLAGINGILLGFGAAGANLTWDDPRRMGAGSLGCLGQIVTMLFLPIIFSLFLGPVILFPFLSLPPQLGYLTGLAAGSVLAVTAAVVPPLLARRRVERLGED